MNIATDVSITTITDNDWLPLPIDVSEKPEIAAPIPSGVAQELSGALEEA